jgi:hypothetical protein
MDTPALRDVQSVTIERKHVVPRLGAGHRDRLTQQPAGACDRNAHY